MEKHLLVVVEGCEESLCWRWCVNSQLLARLPFATCAVLMHNLLLKCLSPSELRVQFVCFLSCFWKWAMFKPSGSEWAAHLAKCWDALAKLSKNALIRCLQPMHIKQEKLVYFNHCTFHIVGLIQFKSWLNYSSKIIYIAANWRNKTN